MPEMIHATAEARSLGRPTLALAEFVAGARPSAAPESVRQVLQAAVDYTKLEVRGPKLDARRFRIT